MSQADIDRCHCWCCERGKCFPDDGCTPETCSKGTCCSCVMCPEGGPELPYDHNNVTTCYCKKGGK